MKKLFMSVMMLGCVCFGSQAVAQSVKQNVKPSKAKTEQCCKDKDAKKVEKDCCEKKVDGATSSTAVKGDKKKCDGSCKKHKNANGAAKKCCKKGAKAAKKADYKLQECEKAPQEAKIMTK